MFHLFAAAIIGYVFMRASSHGGGSALRRGFFIVALIAPTWLIFQLRSIRLDFRVIVAVAGLGSLFIFPPKNKIVYKPMMGDLLMMTLFVAVLISQFLAGAMAPLTPFDIAAQWLSAFMMGRFFLQDHKDIDDMAPVVVWVFVVVCALGLFEAIVKMNIINTILGKRFSLLEQGEGYRWGMKRSQGNVVHPIYNGFQLVMLFPWAAEVSRRAKENGGPKIYQKITWVAGTAAFFSISRGPQIALFLTNAIIFFFRHPKLRIPLLVAGVSIVSAIVIGKEAVMHTLGKMAGESEEDVRIIYIDGEETEYTGTKHRILLLKVYAEALEKSGYFGWGKAMKGIVLEESIAQRFGSIDSHYLMFYIQYGYVGIGCFLALMLTVTLYSIFAAWDAKGPWCTLAGGLSGSFLSIGLLMSSVWFAPDYAAIWLFNAGLITNIRSLPKQLDFGMTEPGEKQPEEKPKNTGLRRPVRNLVPVTQI